MSLEVVLLVLRAAGALLLLAILAVFMLLLWRDHLLTAREVETRTQRRGRLVVLPSATNGERPSALPAGTTFPLLPLTSLGRGPTNTIPIEDAFASGEHALLTLRGGQWWLEDRGSSNGTLLNGYRIEEPVVISTGDVIGLGHVELKLELE
jgi:hypothetical protein